jgi:hypothetical protein
MRNTKPHSPAGGSAGAPWRALARRAEGGSTDGGTFSDTLYMPFLVGLLLIGVALGLVGFWRVGASYSTQRGAQLGAVSPEEGDDMVAALWRAWSNREVTGGGFEIDSSDRSVSASIDASQSFNFASFGSQEFDISAGGQMRIRSERFYPGQP